MTLLRTGCILRPSAAGIRALMVTLLLMGSAIERVEAQSIVPEHNSTGTIVSPTGNQYTISGGQRSSDGANLFHSFERFGLSQGEIANFLSDPATQNILGRVVGGDASIINGLIQVTGGSPNLFLINPAGIVFGPAASLNVPAAFTATTANGVGFNDRWFSAINSEAIGSNDYAALVGSPDSFAFTSLQPGAIVNAAQLAVSQGQRLTLLGGTVVNTGTLTAPGGQITIAAVPGENRVRVSQQGSLLSLEFQPIAAAISPVAPLPFTPPSLPQLLTGGGGGNATGLVVNPDGSVSLTGSGVQIPVEAGTAIVSGQVFTTNWQPGTAASQIDILGDRVGLFSATVDASGVGGGGTVRIGGDYQGQGTLPRAARTVVSSDSVIYADALQAGDGGSVVVWADQTAGFYGTIAARGGAASGNGGVVEVSAQENVLFRGSVDTSAPVGNVGTLLLDPTNITIVNGSGAVDDGQLAAGTPAGDAAGRILAGHGGAGDFTISEVALESLAASASVTLEATNDITINDLDDNTLNLQALNGSVTLTADSDGNGVGTFSMNPGDTIAAPRGNLTLSGAVLNLGGIQGGTQAYRTIQLTGDEINLLGGPDSVRTAQQVSSTGTVSYTPVYLNLQPRTAGRPIRIGAQTTSDPSSLNLTASDIDTIASNFALIRIGGLTGTGDITVVDEGSPVVFNNPLSLFAIGATNRILVQGSLEASSLRLRANEIDFTGGIDSIRADSIWLQPENFTQNTIVGGASNDAAGALNITAAEVDALAPLTGNRIFSLAIDSGAGGRLEVGVPLEADFIRFTGREIDLLVAPGSIRTNNISFVVGTSNQAVTVGEVADNPDDLTLDISTRDLSAVAPLDSQFSFFRVFGGQNTLRVQSSLTANSIELRADEIELTSGPGSIRTNSLTLGISTFPVSLPYDITVGGTDDTGTNTLDITTADLSAVAPLSSSTQFTFISLVGGSGTLTIQSPLPAAASVRFQADEIDLVSGPGTIRAGSASFNTSTSGQNIAFGGTAEGTPALDITTRDLDAIALQGASSSVTAQTSSGNITIANPTALNSDLNLSAGTGSVVVSQPLTVAGDLSVSGTSGLSVGANITTGGYVDFPSTVTITQPVTITSAGTAYLPTTITGAGELILSANQASTSGSLTTNGTSIRLLLNSGFTLSSTVSTNGGNFTISSPGTISVSEDASIQTTGGDITLSGTNINTTAITLDSSNPAGQGGNISLTASSGIAATGDINSSGLSGGDVSITARQAILTGAINSSGSVGSGGNVTLDPIGDIQVSTINAQGGDAGSGGIVDITTERFFRATGTFLDNNDITASISTAGGDGGGAITIRHGGGVLNTSFVVGDGSRNGTAAAITTGTANTIFPTQSFSNTYIQGSPPSQIQIISTKTSSTNDSSSLDSLATDLERRSNYLQPNSSSDLPAIVAIDPAALELEQLFTGQFVDYLGLADRPIQTLAEIQDSLRKITAATGLKPALIYIRFVSSNPQSTTSGNAKSQEQPDVMWQFNAQELTADRQTERTLLNQPAAQDSDRLELILVTARGTVIRKQVPNATRSQVLAVAKEFQRRVTDASSSNGYRASARQLYQWLVAPLTADLRQQAINNLVFIPDVKLRSLPFAALMNQQRFLIEDYSVGLMPSMSLTDTRYVSLKKAQVLAMGASQFSNLQDLPAVPIELSIITQKLFQGRAVLNDTFTPDNLQALRRQQPYPIVHLATHAQFKPGQPSNSFIQFWADSQLKLDQIEQIRFDNPPTEMLVLSACQTALGNEEAELGFAGSATKAGVKTVLASLWTVSDEATLGLMAELYQQLKVTSTKAEALRRAQLALLRNQVRLQEGQLRWPGGAVNLPPELAELGNANLSHPYYWSAFTVIGNPW